MSLARVAKLADLLKGWRDLLETGKELDEAAAKERGGVLEELRGMLRRPPGVNADEILIAAAAAALETNANECRRIDWVHRLRLDAAERAKKSEQRAQRPARWRALPPAVRAAFRAAEICPRAMRPAFFAFATALQATEPGEPSALFEPERIPGIDMPQSFGVAETSY